MKSHGAELGRYVVNGLLATAAHYAVLRANLEWLGVPSAALANLMASVVGIAASFLGSRYFVFRDQSTPILAQFMGFATLYGAIATLHGLILWVWSDRYRLDYSQGFLIATGAQVSLSYFGNKFMVFRA